MGVDLGTQGVRVVVAGDDGTVVGAGTRALTSRRSGDRHEQDPEDWWSATQQAIIAAGHDGADLARVRALAVDATSGSIAMIDQDGRAVTSGLMYDDGRAVHECARVNVIGYETWQAAGYRRMQQSWALPKLLWLLEHHPDAGRPGIRLAHQSDLINRRLVGHDVATDSSNALKTGVDLVTIGWPHATMSALQVPDDVLPPVVLPGTVLGGVSAAVAAATGLAPGTDVVAGMTDGCAAQLGAGVIEPGSWNSVLGTTLVLKGVTGELIHDPGGVVYSHRSPNGQWLPGGASSSGAGLIARDFASHYLDELTAYAKDHLPTDLLRYPLHARGERFPFVAPAAFGFTSRAPRDRLESFAAILQGVSYVERLSFDYLDLLGADTTGEIRATGGATRNEVWTQLRADVLGRPLTLPVDAQPALGMAILAAAGSRGLASAAAAMVRVSHTVEPRADATTAHHEGYANFVDQLEQRQWLPSPVAAHARKRNP